MENISELQTIETIENLNILESIIKNPNIKIDDLLKGKEFNGYYLDLVLSLNQFLMNKDRTIKKTNEEQKFKNFLLKKVIEVYTETNGNINIEQFIEEINRVRNNIGHGKYYINKDNLNVVLSDTGEEIPYRWIRSMIEELFIDNKNKLTKLPIKTGYIARNNNDKIDIDNILPSLKNFNVCEYNINSTSESFDENGLSLIQHEIEKFKNNADNIFNNNIKMNEYNASMNNCKLVAELSNINFSKKIYNMYEIDDELKNEIEMVIKNNYELLKNASQESLETFLKGFMNDFYFDKEDSLQLDKAFSQLTFLSRIINENRHMTYNELKSKYYNLPPTDNQMLVAVTLAKFNLLYSYNADTIFRDYLDYSKIDLSKLNPSINTNSHYKLTETENKQIFKLEKDAKNFYKKYTGMKTKIKEQNEKQKELMNGFNLRTYESLFDILELKDAIRKKEFNKNDNVYNEELYKNNKEIINHIRNSIIHNNIEINNRIINNNLSTCITTFRDFDNGNKTFELTTSLDNINNICNLKELLEVLHQNNNYEQGKSMKGFINTLMLYLLTTLLISVGIFYLMCYFGI